ncbi:MAG: hypothetical protein ABIW02_02790 [Nitrosospira sp.]
MSGLARAIARYFPHFCLAAPIQQAAGASLPAHFGSIFKNPKGDLGI